MVMVSDVCEAESDSTTCTDSEPVAAMKNKVRGREKAELVADIEEGESSETQSEHGVAVLRQYGQRFAEMRQGDMRPFVRKAFPWQLAAAGEEAVVPAPAALDVRAELEQDLGLAAEDADGAQPKKLALTFGYAGNLDQSPPFARFDIRDHVCLRVGGFKHGQVVRDEEGKEFIVIGVKRVEGAPRLWFQPRALKRPAAGAFPGASAAALRVKLSPVQKAVGVGGQQEQQKAGPRLRLSVRLREASVKDFDAAEGSDGEELLLCQHCHFPIGEFAYAGKDREGSLMHGECMAQCMLRDFKEEEEANQQEEAAMKLKRRAEYDIGWQVDRVPRNIGAAQKLGCSPVPQGMCCLVLDEAAHTVRVAPTAEPAASVNLEYLALALQVRLREGKEPMFSLDPVDPSKGGTMQFKRFEPEWLAGTSAGEVLFQADYHLKELSMGEYEQPVLGMKSCFDFSEEEGHAKEWSAREWFVVRKAEVHLSEDDVLIPYLRMGVQAREQILGPNGLEDCELTRPDHPLVKYAEAFTRNFDLIAERRSVIYHLRELAKATVLAKYLIESDVWMDEAWLDAAGEAKTTCVLEVPQLWNERCHSQIKMKDGAILNMEKGFGSSVHSVYGGVDFGLGRFRLAAAQRPSGVLHAAMAAPPHIRPTGVGVPPGFEPKSVRGAPVQRPAIFHPKPALAAAPVEAKPLVTPPPVSRPGAPPRAAMPRAAPPPRAARPVRPVRAARPVRPAAPVEARGVDLNLDGFNLSAAVPLASDGTVGSWGANVKSVDAGASIGGAFWSSIDGASASVFKEQDASLLMGIFNPYLSDRRNEGDRFVPPDTSFSYVEKLRSLVKDEDEVRKQRMNHFFSTKFVMEDAGPLFPSSWRSAFEIARGRVPVRPAGESLQGGLLHPRSDYKAEAPAFEHMLKSATPVFDRSTEDGIRFRIYRFGSLEVRTTQEHNGEETIGAVFSIRESQASAEAGSQDRTLSDRERIIKVTQYVERAHRVHAMKGHGAHWRSYVVLETDQGNVVVTEQLADGMVTWEENPKDLEDRNSLAKVIRSCFRQSSSVTIEDMQNYRNKDTHIAESGASHSKCKRYAQGAYSQATAVTEATRMSSGFRRQAKGDKWQLGKVGPAGPDDASAGGHSEKKAAKKDPVKKYLDLQEAVGFTEQAKYFKMKALRGQGKKA